MSGEVQVIHAGKRHIQIGDIEVLLPRGFSVSIDRATTGGGSFDELTLSFQRSSAAKEVPHERR